jgi:hypothetical protein
VKIFNINLYAVVERMLDLYWRQNFGVVRGPLRRRNLHETMDSADEPAAETPLNETAERSTSNDAIDELDVDVSRHTASLVAGTPRQVVDSAKNDANETPEKSSPRVEAAIEANAAAGGKQAKSGERAKKVRSSATAPKAKKSPTRCRHGQSRQHSTATLSRK